MREARCTAGASVAADGRMAFYAPHGKLRRPTWELLCLLFIPATAVAQRVEVVSALEQVFPTDAPRGEKAARLEAARGEWEPFQIVVTGPLRAVRARVEGPFQPRPYP